MVLNHNDKHENIINSAVEKVVPRVELRPWNEIKQILEENKNLFSIRAFHEKCNGLIQKWYLTVFHDHVPKTFSVPILPCGLKRKSRASVGNPSTAQVKKEKKSKEEDDDTDEHNEVDSSAIYGSECFHSSIAALPPFSDTQEEGHREEEEVEDEKVFASRKRQKWTQEETRCLEVSETLFYCVSILHLYDKGEDADNLFTT